MRIALDAMGGDLGPGAVAAGAIQALSQGPRDLELVLVGRPEEIEPHLNESGAAGRRLHVAAAPDVAGMSDSPSYVVRNLPRASIRVAFDLHASGEVAAVVSAGNSGAIMAVGMLVLGRLPGLDRPAAAAVFPGIKAPTVVLDVGANMDCSALMLLQFGFMGSVYAQWALGYKNPSVGLLSIGEEGGKGNNVVKRAYDLLKDSPLNFVGNIEGRDLFSGDINVVVCDGFVGNVCLKLAEGLLRSYNQLMHTEVLDTPAGMLGGLFLKPSFKRLARRMDHEAYGGAPLLGLKGVGYICHGNSRPKAIASAVRMAQESVNGKVDQRLSQGWDRYSGSALNNAAAS
jgi:glycerol-3-phosphate acyltransferase PlsX